MVVASPGYHLPAIHHTDVGDHGVGWRPRVAGFDWFWIVLAVFLDLSHYAHTAYNNRNAIPGYTPAPTQPAA